jgi:CrcB protein
MNVFETFGAKLVLAALGGSVGAASRFAIGHHWGKLWAFPWATFGINVAGSFLLGFLFVTVKDRTPLLVLLGAGFCGGFTTFSAFSLETLVMIEAERWLEAGAYVFGSVLAGLLGVWLGVLLGKAC